MLNEEIPCRLVNNFCLIPAKVDGEAGYLILDTGAPGLVLNRPATGQQREGLSCTQEVSVGATQVKELQWADHHEHDVTAYTLEMDHLSRATDLPILGLLGYERLQDYEILLDYQQERLLLYPARENQLHERIKPQRRIAFSMQSHLPIVTLTYGDRTYRFILDTGAGSNLISPALYQQLHQTASLTDKEELRGLDGEIQVVTKAHLSGLHIDDFAVPTMEYLVQDLDHLQSMTDLQIDGLLGAPFLQLGTFSINFVEQKLFLWRIFP